MAKIFLTYYAVPELAPLSRAKRHEVLRASGRRFFKTPQFWRVWLLGLALCLALPAIVALVLDRWKTDPILVAWIVVGIELLGYCVWFHVRTSCLRPHIRAYLAEQEAARA